MSDPIIHPMAEMLDQHFGVQFAKILDIGAAFGDVTRSVQKLHGSHIWILEGDAKNNAAKTQRRKGKWNDTADTFSYYHSLDQLRKMYKALGAHDFHIVDCDNIDIDADIKFDLICSYLSCGFHYPLSTYYDLIQRHSHSNTKYVFDLRMGKGQLQLPPEAEILHTFFVAGRKYARCELRFNFANQQ
jgi:hypothetical protein